MKSIIMAPETLIYSLLIVVLPLFLIIIFRLSIFKVSIILFIISLIICIRLSKTNYILQYIFNGGFSGIKISLIIFSAVFFYNVYNVLGFEEKLKKIFYKNGENKLIIASLSIFFSGFIENLTGYGVPVTVVSPLLVSLGINPVDALAYGLIGHSWAVPYASLGIPTLVIAEIVEINEYELFKYTSIFMFISLVSTIIVFTEILKLKWKDMLICLSASTILLPLSFYTYNFSGLITGISAFLITIFIGYRDIGKNIVEHLYPYIVLAIILLTENLFGFRGFIWSSFTVFIIALFFLIKYNVDFNIFPNILKKVVKRIGKSIITIILLTCIAEISKQLGLMKTLAIWIAYNTGIFYTIIIPLIGFIGTYVTGSCTASNIIFSLLQYSYSNTMKLNPTIILSLQNVGGGLGSMISPAKATVGSIALSISGREKDSIKIAFKKSIIFLLPLFISALILIH